MANQMQAKDHYWEKRMLVIKDFMEMKMQKKVDDKTMILHLDKVD